MFVSFCFQCLLLRCYSMFRSEICCSVYKCIIVRLDMNVSSSTTEIHQGRSACCLLAKEQKVSPTTSQGTCGVLHYKRALTCQYALQLRKHPKHSKTVSFWTSSHNPTQPTQSNCFVWSASEALNPSTRRLQLFARHPHPQGAAPVAAAIAHANCGRTWHSLRSRLRSLPWATLHLIKAIQWDPQLRKQHHIMYTHLSYIYNIYIYEHIHLLRHLPTLFWGETPKDIYFSSG